MGFGISIKSKKPSLFLFAGVLISIFFISILVSGCFDSPGGIFKDSNAVIIQDVDVMSALKGESTLLTVTPYLRNDQDTDSSMLSVKVKIIDQETQLIVAEKNMDMGYIKARSQTHNSLSLEVEKPGNYDVEVQLFEDNQPIGLELRTIVIKTNPSTSQPADILLTDMNLIITQFTDKDSKAVVDVSPAIYNQGGDSKALTMIVTAKKDSYTTYSESDELGIVKGSSRLRGHVSFVLLRNAEYALSVTVEENGRELVTSEITQPVKLDQIERNVAKNYSLVQKGTPIEAPTKRTGSPGFESSIMFAVLLLTAGIVKISVLKNKKGGNGGLNG
jgi:hypothetical protein